MPLPPSSEKSQEEIQAMEQSLQSTWAEGKKEGEGQIATSIHSLQLVSPVKVATKASECSGHCILPLSLSSVEGEGAS